MSEVERGGMTVHRRPRAFTKPGEPRHLWPAHTSSPPAFKPDAARPALAWTGSLEMLPSGAASGVLRANGWVLAVFGRTSRALLQLRAAVQATGPVLPAFEDSGLSSDLHDSPPMPFDMVRDGDGWTGRIAGTGWALVIRGTLDGAGRLRLDGTVERQQPQA